MGKIGDKDLRTAFLLREERALRRRRRTRRRRRRRTRRRTRKRTRARQLL